MRKEYIKSLRLAGYLMLNGFKLYEIQKDKNATNLDVYIFRGSEELTSTILRYINSKNGETNGYYIKTRRNNNRI